MGSCRLLRAEGAARGRRRMLPGCAGLVLCLAWLLLPPCATSPCLEQCRCYMNTLLCQEPDTIRSLAQLRSLENFTEIVIENQTALTNLTLEDMKNPRELKNLTISKTQLQFISPDAFRASPNLTHVELEKLARELEEKKHQQELERLREEEEMKKKSKRYKREAGKEKEEAAGKKGQQAGKQEMTKQPSQ